MKETIRKLLQIDASGNPFNSKFDFELLIENLFKEISPNELVNTNLKDTLLFLPFLNKQYKQSYDYITKVASESGLNQKELLDNYFALCNRNVLIHARDLEIKAKSKEDFDLRDHYSNKINSLDDSIGKIEVGSALEAEVGALNILVNFLRSNNEKLSSKIKNLVQPERIITLYSSFIASIYYSILKEEYDEGVWNNGYFKTIVLEPKLKIVIKYDDTNLLIKNKIGHLRFQRNIVSNFLFASQAIRNETPHGLIIENKIRKTKKEKKIKQISLQNDFISYKLAKGFNKVNSFEELKIATEYTTYYPFLKDVVLKNTEGLQVGDFISMFSLLQDLVDRIHSARPMRSDYVESIQDSAFKILESTVIQYLEERSYYTRKQIKFFLGLIVSTP